MRIGLILTEALVGLRRNLSMVISVVLVTFVSLTFVGVAGLYVVLSADFVAVVQVLIYAGAVGYLDFAGNLDFCITIRTLVIAGSRAMVQAGAGIVADSNPQAEYEETRDKARALIRALELAHEGL